MIMSTRGVFKRCGCREPETGKQRGAECSRLDEAGHGSWWFTAEGPVTADGARSRVRRGGYATEEAAGEARNRTLAAAKGIGLTTGQWLDRWLAGSRLRSSTVRAYRGHVTGYLKPRLGHVPVAALSVADVQTVFTAIAGEAGIGGRRLAPASVARIRSTLSSALTAAVREQVIAHNPARGREIDLPKARKPRPLVWTDARVAHWRETGRTPGPVCVWTREQTVEFLRAIAGEKRYLYYHLIAVTGLRRAEAAALRESDVDLRSSEVFVAPQPGQQADDDGELKSPASARTLALDHVTRGLLRRYLADRRNVPSAEDGNRYLFSTPGGRPCGLSLFSHEFKELLYGCTSLPPIRLHDLRHGAASLSLAAGNDLKDIQEMLGHASLSFTADYYVSVYPSRRHSTAERIGSFLFPAKSNRFGRASRQVLCCRRLAGRLVPGSSQGRTSATDHKSAGNSGTR
ncbi:site-specific integrase [Amycolatopsis panacis]|uniref:Site-specific integrase n=1 Tax=Amycolatopsis panacis TaxID=2340917 RepID=A0A419HXA3_9PSEU|nr:site-specific integrase [Amycolatopsis panacis]